ncbi:glycosyltransferase [Marinihelvus fidelis]|uniref:Glycosyltransferase n=1 Tax=Marinihelvus fidelis TaxID=2613842 RepID=A0A5N0TBP0_9GAMM|nr:glycosyltransferase [Marinihelvus fidelis]KAA9130759.1 glycosyltransferase [Marinihelvus fidelis]
MIASTGLPTVVLPVHDAIDCLRGCLASIDAHSPEARVVVVDDASADPAVRPLLVDWCAASPGRELVPLDHNLGFVGAANLGAERAGGDDIVLLNSDTLVTPGWLQALARCLASDPAIGSATPWSNNGEIVSIPVFCQANPVPADPARVAAAIAAAGEPVYPKLPTAVGFCMAISRRAIDRLGLFDADTFGRGYGEENDFSLRVTAAGMRNVLCDDAYVAHVGGQSFGAVGLAPGEDSMRRLLGKHPGYLDLVTAWIAADPLAGRRAEVVAALG